MIVKNRAGTQFHVGGRKAPTVKCKLHIRDFHPNLAAFGPIPDETHYGDAPTAQVVLTNVLGNDQYGCCTEADQYHRQALRQAAACAEVYPTQTSDVLATYTRDTGFNAADPNTDQGADETVVLTNHMKLGITSGVGEVDRSVGYLQIDETNMPLVRACCTAFVGLNVCMALPDAWTMNMPSGPGFVWGLTDGKFVPNPQSGHSFTFADQSSGSQQRIWAWGIPGFLTNDAFMAGCSDANGGAVYAELDADVLLYSIQKAPDGLDWAALVKAFESIGGSAPMALPSGGDLTLIQKIEAEGEHLIEWLERKLGRKL